MPDTICPRCGREGFVRHERVVRGTDAVIRHYCGACFYEWQIADAAAKRSDDPGQPVSPAQSDKTGV
jgi:hypothetical protein